MEENNKKSDAAVREEKVLEFWRANKTFPKTLSATKGKKEFIFYEGPPMVGASGTVQAFDAARRDFNR